MNKKEKLQMIKDCLDITDQDCTILAFHDNKCYVRDNINKREFMILLSCVEPIRILNMRGEDSIAIMKSAYSSDQDILNKIAAFEEKWYGEKTDNQKFCAVMYGKDGESDICGYSGNVYSLLNAIPEYVQAVSKQMMRIAQPKSFRVVRIVVTETDKTERIYWDSSEEITSLMESVRYLNSNVPDGNSATAGTILAKAVIKNISQTISAEKIMDILEHAEDKTSVEALFLEFSGMSVKDYLKYCIQNISRREDSE